MSGIALAFYRAAAVVPTAVLAYTPRDWVHDDRFRKLLGAMLWILVVLMTVPEGLHYENLTNADAPSSGDFVSRILWLGLLCAGLTVIMLRPALTGLMARTLNPFLLAFSVLVAFSVVWSINPAVTTRRLLRVLTISVDAFAFVLVGWHAMRFQNVLRPIVTLMLAGSIVFGLLRPDLAIHPDTSGVLMNAWHGLANHKNGFGDIACVGLIFWFHAWLSKESLKFLDFAGCVLSVVCLVLSRSTTSFIAALFALLMMTMLMRSPPQLRRYMPFLVGSFIGVLMLYSLALLHFVPGLDVLMSPIDALSGKDMSFTGRTAIWDITSAHLRANPMLGTGYGAYWTGAEIGSPSYEFVERLGFYPGSAHNGYLEILNDLGAVGLIVLFGFLGSFVFQSLKLLRIDRNQAALCLALFLHQAIANLSESRWLSAMSVDFVIMTVATASLARGLIEHRFESVLAALRLRESYRTAATIR